MAMKSLSVLSLAIALIAQVTLAAEPAPSARQKPWLKPLLEKTWTGDLDGMIERGVIRALVVYSKTYYFVDKGTQRGLSYEYLKLFEDELNAHLKKQKKRPVIMVFIPVSRDQLIPALKAGRGDIAAAGLIVTPERDKTVDFSNPTVSPVDEIIVTGPASPKISQLADLSGKEIFVRSGRDGDCAG
jgi:membrane-bound lytic murein transglycosylase MltF